MSEQTQTKSDETKEGVKPDLNIKNDDPLSVLSPEAQKLFKEVNAGLLSALDKEREARSLAEKQAKTLAQTAQEAEKSRLKAMEDYKQLYEKAEGELSELRPKAETLTAYEAVLKKTLESAIAEIPEDRRSLIPVKMSIQDQLEWISTNRALLSKAQSFDIGAGHRGGSSPETDDLSQEEIQTAQKFGLSSADYVKYKKK
jgi:hypothetical protein